MLNIKSIFINSKINKIIAIVLGAGALVFFALYFFPSGSPKLEYKILTPEYLMSSIYKIYGNENLGFWTGKAVLKNNGKAPAYDVKLAYKIEGTTDWNDAKTYAVIEPGSTIVDLYYPILPKDLANLNAPTPTNLKIKITYAEKSEGKEKEIDESKPITILGGHDFIFSSIPPEESTGNFYDIFSNYPLLAAWITPTDPPLRGFADLGNKLAGGAGASLSDDEAVKSLAGMWQVAVNNGIEYKTEPTAFWTGKFSQFVKYPRDTIKDKAGTCLDTALFFASAASAQGLKSYVILMPGHAFPLIQLPQSGDIIPVESTALNSKVSFEEAVQAGTESYNKAVAGPYVVVDVEKFQSLGIIPPELENLPSDVLSKWGIGEYGGSAGGSSGQSSSSTSSTSGGGNSQTKTSYTNQYPSWKVSYLADWSVVPSGNEVDFYSPSRLTEFVVTWGYGLTSAQARSTIEQFLLQPMGATLTSEGQGSVAGVSATKVSYSANVNGAAYEIHALYFEAQNHGFAILYDFPTGTAAAESNCQSILNSFTF
jgi:hypothetical protein